MDDYKLKDNFPIMKHIVMWFLFGVLLIGGLMWGGLLAKPAWLSLERAAFTNSYQYIEGKKAAIARYTAQCVGLKEGPQKQALRQKIIAEKMLIPTNEASKLRGC